MARRTIPSITSAFALASACYTGTFDVSGPSGLEGTSSSAGTTTVATSPDPATTARGDEPMPTGQWTCVSFEMDSLARRLRMYVDGGATPIDDLVVDTVPVACPSA